MSACGAGRAEAFLFHASKEMPGLSPARQSKTDFALAKSNPCGPFLLFLGFEKLMLTFVSMTAGDGALRGVPAEGVESNEVRTRGRLPPLEVGSAIAYFFRFSASRGDFPLSETRKSAIFVP